MRANTIETKYFKYFCDLETKADKVECKKITLHKEKTTFIIFVKKLLERLV